MTGLGGIRLLPAERSGGKKEDPRDGRFESNPDRSLSAQRRSALGASADAAAMIIWQK